MSIKSTLTSVKKCLAAFQPQRGEIATILTLISVGLMLAGIVVGNVAVKQTTRTQSKAQATCISGCMTDTACTSVGGTPVFTGTQFESCIAQDVSLSYCSCPAVVNAPPPPSGCPDGYWSCPEAPVEISRCIGREGVDGPNTYHAADSTGKYTVGKNKYESDYNNPEKAWKWDAAGGNACGGEKGQSKTASNCIKTTCGIIQTGVLLTLSPPLRSDNVKTYQDIWTNNTQVDYYSSPENCSNNIKLSNNELYSHCAVSALPPASTTTPTPTSTPTPTPTPDPTKCHKCDRSKSPIECSTGNRITKGSDTYCPSQFPDEGGCPALDCNPAVSTPTPTNEPTNVNCATYRYQWTPEGGVCNSPASSDEIAKFKDKTCDTSFKEENICYSGAKHSHFVCLPDTDGKFKWYKDSGNVDDPFFCTDKGEVAGIIPTPTGVSSTTAAACNNIQADCRITRDKECTPGNVWNECLPNRDCPDDARFGVAYPFLCDKSGSSFLMNRYGECSPTCKGSAYNLTPTKAPDCVDAGGNNIAAGTVITKERNFICLDMVCVIIPGKNVSHWVKTNLTCDGAGYAYTTPQDTGVACNLTAGKETWAQCVGDPRTTPPVPTVRASLNIRPTTAPNNNSSCQQYKCVYKDKIISRKGDQYYDSRDACLDSTKITGDTARFDAAAACGYTSNCEFLGGTCKDSGTGCDISLKEDTLNSKKFKYCPTDTKICCNPKKNDPPLIKISPTPSSGETKVSQDSTGICKITFPSSVNKSTSFKVTVDSLDPKYCPTANIKLEFKNTSTNATLPLVEGADPQKRCDNPLTVKNSWIFNSVSISDPGTYKINATFNTINGNDRCGGNETIEIKGTGAAQGQITNQCGLPTVGFPPGIDTKNWENCADCLYNKAGAKDKINSSPYDEETYSKCDPIKRTIVWCNDKKEDCKPFMANSLCKVKNKCLTNDDTNPKQIQFGVLLPQSFTNEDFDNLVAARRNNLIDARYASLWILNATRVPGLQRLYCDPFQGQCDYGVTPGVQQQVDLSAPGNSGNNGLMFPAAVCSDKCSSNLPAGITLAECQQNMCTGQAPCITYCNNHATNNNPAANGCTGSCTTLNAAPPAAANPPAAGGNQGGGGAGGYEPREKPCPACDALDAANKVKDHFNNNWDKAIKAGTVSKEDQEKYNNYKDNGGFKTVKDVDPYTGVATEHLEAKQPGDPDKTIVTHPKSDGSEGVPCNNCNSKEIPP